MAVDLIDAILPAGGTLTQADGTKVYKARLKVGERSLLEIVTGALRASGRVRRIVLIGPQEVVEGQDGDIVLEPGASGPDNIYRGLDALLSQPDPPANVLIATTDLPFLTGPGVAEFLNLVDPKKQLNVPIVKEKSFVTQYPGAHATFVRLREGGFTLGGLFHLNAQAMLTTRPHIEAVFEARKSKFQLAKMFGLSILVKYLSGRLSLPEIESTAERILACTAKTLPEAPVELAFDVDNLAEYDYAVAKLKS
jgi:hypothetical protein